MGGLQELVEAKASSDTGASEKDVTLRLDRECITDISGDPPMPTFLEDFYCHYFIFKVQKKNGVIGKAILGKERAIRNILLLHGRIVL